MARHNDLGKWGEQLAADLLVTKGYAIAERNWRSGKKEMDIIAFKDNFVVFVEVKTRSDDFVDPGLAVDRRRIARLVSAANAYIRNYNIPHDVRFDVITVVGNPLVPDKVKIAHIVDAFLPPLRTVR